MDDFLSCRSREQRRPMWTQHEKTVLRILMRQYAGVSEFDPPDIHKHPIKNEMWRLLTTRYNAQPNVRSRDAKQLRKAWENLKYRARKISADRDFKGKLKGRQQAWASDGILFESSSEIASTQADDVGSSTIEEDPSVFSTLYDTDEAIVGQSSSASEEELTFSDNAAFKTPPNCDSTSKVDDHLSEDSDTIEGPKLSSVFNNILALPQLFPFFFAASPTTCMIPFPWLNFKSEKASDGDRGTFEDCLTDTPARSSFDEPSESASPAGHTRPVGFAPQCSEAFLYGRQLMKENLHLLREKIRQEDEGHQQMIQLLATQKVHAEAQHEIKMKSLQKQLTFWCKRLDALDCLTSMQSPATANGLL